MHDRTGNHSPVSAAGRYALHVDQGLVAATPGEASLAGTACLELAAALDEWAALAPGTAALQALHSVCARELPALKVMLRGQLHYHLGGALLRTRQVVIETQRLLEGSPPSP